MLVDDFEDPASQEVALEQVAEVEDGRLVGDGLAEREEAEGSHRLGLVEEVLRAGVAEVVAELHGVDAQHHGEGVGPPPAAGLGVVGLDGCFVRRSYPALLHSSAPSDGVLLLEHLYGHDVDVVEPAVLHGGRVVA